ncbi:MAG: DUF3696 domain-containing protein [Anaerolineae bacterium]|nr:DUF3696 domain-containing protein [Anaerolineae bacterium]
MLTRLRAQNFKSWRDTGELEIAPLTGLFGTNSSGKTSILQLLLMLKQTVESPDRRRVLHFGDERSLVDLGTFYDVIYAHKANESLGLSLSWNLRQPLQIDNPETGKQLFQIETLSFSASVRQQNDRLGMDWFAYRFDEYQFGMKRRPEDDKEKDRYELVNEPYIAKRTLGRKWPLPAPVKCYGFPDEAVGYYQNTGFLPDFVLAFENLFSGITYLGPLREYPKRSYVWAGESPLDVGRRGELAIPALLASRSMGKISFGHRKRHRTVEEQVGYRLKQMKLVDSFMLKPLGENRKDYELCVETRLGGPQVLITDVGFGVSQILPVLVLCYYVPEGSIILLEQPEIHLHPSVQADLADVLIDVVNNRNVQIIVESHSEHLLRRLQRRIAEEELAPEKAALYFCRIEGGESRIERLQLDLFGDITNWPEDFWADEMADRAAQVEAMARRTGAGQR